MDGNYRYNLVRFVFQLSFDELSDSLVNYAFNIDGVQNFFSGINFNVIRSTVFGQTFESFFFRLFNCRSTNAQLIFSFLKCLWKIVKSIFFFLQTSVEELSVGRFNSFFKCRSSNRRMVFVLPAH